MECRGSRRRWCWAPCSDAPKNLPPAASSHSKKKKKQPIKNNLGGNEISIIDCKAVYPTHLKCRRRWRRPESPHVGRGCMHARLERRRREKKGWRRSREERRNKQTVGEKKTKKNKTSNSKAKSEREALLSSRPHASSPSSFFARLQRCRELEATAKVRGEVSQFPISEVVCLPPAWVAPKVP